jgi:hypothetical protein
VSQLIRLLDQVAELRNQRRAPLLSDHWLPAEIAEYRAWRAGGPLPESIGGLDIVSVDLQLGDYI